jgi:uncharacterized membrane protein
MKNAVAEVFKVIADGDGEPSASRKRSFAVLLFGIVLIVAAAIAGSGLVQQVLSLAATLALLASMYLTVEPKGISRVIFAAGASALTLVSSTGIASVLTGGLASKELEGVQPGLLLVAVIPLVVVAFKTKLIDPQIAHNSAPAE